MEEVIFALFQVFIAVIVVGNIIKKLIKHVENSLPPLEADEPKEKETAEQFNLDEPKDSSKNKPETTLSGETDSVPQSTMTEKELASGTAAKPPTQTDKIKSSEQEVLIQEEISTQDLKRGIVFKELLDKPRSKRPHPFFRRDK